MENKINIKYIHLIIIVVWILHSNKMIITCRPSSSLNRNNLRLREALELGEYDYGINSEELRKVEICHKDDDLMELCQRCAKATKSKIVFPMCCSNEDNAKDWCDAYIHYGIQ